MGKLILNLLKGFNHPFKMLLKHTMSLSFSLKFGHIRKLKRNWYAQIFLIFSPMMYLPIELKKKITLGSPWKQFLHNVWKA